MGKSRETCRAYRIILSGYQEIQLVNSSRLVPILGLLAKLGKAAVSFVTFVCPSVRTEQLVSHWISEDLVFDNSKSVYDIQDPLKSDTKGLFTC